MKYSSTVISVCRYKLQCRDIPLRQLHKFAWLFNSFVANMKETRDPVAKQKIYFKEREDFHTLL